VNPIPANVPLALLDRLPEAIAVIDVREPGLAVVLANDALQRLRGKGRDELLRLDLAGLLGEPGGAARMAELGGHIARGESVTVRIPNPAARQGSGSVDVRCEPLRDAAGVVTHYVTFHQPVAEPPGAEPAPIVRTPLPRDDRLTGLRHAEYFHELYRRDFAIAQRESRALVLFLVDIDALGSYNDTFGRQAGDSVIRRVGRTLSAGLRRASDLVSRLEGGRFVGLSAGMDLAQARRHAETLAARIRDLHMHHPHSPVARVVTVSIGVTHLVPGRQATPEQLLQSGYHALEAARAGGRNRVAAAEPPAG
jgi:diguanylate cyclase (GGDEF)-like protein